MSRPKDPIRESLLEKSGWSSSTLTRRIRALNPYMSKRHALLVLARDKGVDLEKHGVDPATILEVGRLLREHRQPNQPKTATDQTGVETTKSKQVKFKAAGYDGPIPASMNGLVNIGHQRSAEAYPAVAVFENSVRELIRRVLNKEHGSGWWETAVPTQIQKKATRYMNDDVEDPWHDPRGEHPLFYIGFWDYTSIIIDDENWPLFQPILDRKSLVVETLRAVNVSRRVVAHNGALSRDDAELLKPTISKWLKHLAARDDLIP